MAKKQNKLFDLVMTLIIGIVMASIGAGMVSGQIGLPTFLSLLSPATAVVGWIVIGLAIATVLLTIIRLFTKLPKNVRALQQLKITTLIVSLVGAFVTLVIGNSLITGDLGLPAFLSLLSPAVVVVGWIVMISGFLAAIASVMTFARG